MFRGCMPQPRARPTSPFVLSESLRYTDVSPLGMGTGRRVSTPTRFPKRPPSDAESDSDADIPPLVPRTHSFPGAHRRPEHGTAAPRRLSLGALRGALGSTRKAPCGTEGAMDGGGYQDRGVGLSRADTGAVFGTGGGAVAGSAESVAAASLCRSRDRYGSGASVTGRGAADTSASASPKHAVCASRSGAPDVHRPKRVGGSAPAPSSPPRRGPVPVQKPRKRKEIAVSSDEDSDAAAPAAKRARPGARHPPGVGGSPGLDDNVFYSEGSGDVPEPDSVAPCRHAVPARPLGHSAESAILVDSQ